MAVERNGKKTTRRTINIIIGVNGQFQKIEKQSYASAATGMPSVPTVQMVS